MGGEKENIVHAKSFSEKILDISAEYFAQASMDTKVKQLFDSIGRAANSINYIDIGTNNWLFYNNTYLFYRAGASGVLVEANPDFYDAIVSNRPRDTALMCGVADYLSDTEWTYYKTNRAGYNTFIKEVADTYKDRGIYIEQEIKVPMKEINEIMSENFTSNHIDYMSVDIEGMGERVVNAIDFNRFDIDVILLEMDHNKPESRKLYLKLLNVGYECEWRGIGKMNDFLFYKKDVFSSLKNKT